MTAYAIDFRADKVAVAADALAYVDDKPVGSVCKTIQIPHLRALLLGRGKANIVTHAVLRLLLSPDLSTLEDAAEGLPDILRDVTANFLLETGTEGDPTSIYLQEVCLLGWSVAEQRMRCWQYTSVTNYEPLLDWDRAYGGPYSWPALPAADMPLDRSRDTLETKMTAVMVAIDEFCARNPDLARSTRLGGDVSMTEITEGSTTHKVIHRFTDHATVERDGAAVLVTDPPAQAQADRRSPAERRRAEAIVRKSSVARVA